MALVALVPVAGLYASETAYLVENGQAKADIVVSLNPPRSVALAAKELQAYLTKITGAQLKIVAEPGTDVPGHIYVGRSTWTDKLGIKDESSEGDGYKIVSGAGHLVLLGNDFNFQPSEPWCKSRADRPRVQREWEEKTGKDWLAPDLTTFKAYNKNLDIWMGDGAGSLYAVYDFLRSLGVEWYMPGELGEIIPRIASVEWPEIVKTVSPDVEKRVMTFVDFFEDGEGVSECALWYFRLGLGGPITGFNHSMQLILSHEHNRTHHPEYYALYNGKRELYARGGKPCLSSEGLFDEMLAYAREYFATYPEADSFPIMPTDGFSNMCQCNLCKGKDTPNRGYAGSMSDYVWGFVNRVAGEIAKSHPDKKIGCGAYSTYLLPPEKIKLHPNVKVQICRWRQYDSGDADSRSKALAIRDAWKAALAPGNLYSWDYYLNSRTGGEKLGVPIFFPHTISEDLKSWKGTLQGEFVEVAKKNGQIAFPGLDHLNIYTTARLYWNIDQDVEALLDEYYARFFGPAGKTMKGFYTRAKASPQSLGANDVEFLQASLKKAEADAGVASIYGRRVALIRNECESKLDELLLQRSSKEEYARLEVLQQSGLQVTVDGLLNEPVWAKSQENTLREVVSGGTPEAPTSFRVAADADQLYIAIVCNEPDMKAVKTSGAKRDDMNIWTDDAVEVIVKTPRHSHYQFAINPAGALLDVDRKDGLDGLLWESGAVAAVSRSENSWTVELSIPLKNLVGEIPSSDNPWHVNIGRSRPRDSGPELSIFVPCGKPTFHNTQKMSTLVFKKGDSNR